MNSKQLKIVADRKRAEYKNYYIKHFSALLHNSFKVKNEDDLPKRYLIGTLIKYGVIYYDKATKLYLRGVKIGIDIYGLPKKYTLIGYNGYTVTRKAEEVVPLRINDLSEPLLPYLTMQSNKIAEYDMAIEQNLEAVKTMLLLGFSDEKSLQSFMNTFESRQKGAIACFVNKNVMQGNTVSVDNSGAQFLVDKLLDARKKILDETYQKLGIQYANTDKKERVQATEVNASLGLAVDSIYTCIDTFNYDAKYGDLPIRLELNTSLEEIYLGGMNYEPKVVNMAKDNKENSDNN